MDLKAKREKELLLNQVFYKTMHTLTLLYPPPQELKSIFKEDMFLKSNKNGFHQVAYYLLNILDAEKPKENVVDLRPYDSRTEKQFCAYIVKFSNELNAAKVNADIPPVMVSQLISSSGIKFISIMLRLAQFALFQYLQTKQSIASKVLLRVRPSHDTEVSEKRLENLEHVTCELYRKCNDLTTDFDVHLAKCRQNATTIINQLSENTKTFKENELRLPTLNEKMANSSYTEVIEKLKLKENLKSLNLISTQIKEYIDSLSLFLSSKSVELQIEIPKLGNEQSELEPLDLIDLFQTFIKALDRKRLEIRPLGNEELIKQTERFQKLNRQLVVMKEDIMKISQEYSKLYRKYENGMMETTCNGLQSDTDSTPLAIPLPESPISSPAN